MAIVTTGEEALEIIDRIIKHIEDALTNKVNNDPSYAQTEEYRKTRQSVDDTKLVLKRVGGNGELLLELIYDMMVKHGVKYFGKQVH